MSEGKKTTYEELRFVKVVPLGSVNPNNPLSEESAHQQEAYLNRCLNDYPKGTIIGKDVTIGRYQIGNHELTMEKVSYHIGFPRKPAWMEDE